MNSAFVFIKPAANTAATQKLVKETFAARGIKITGEGELTGKQIDEGKLIDQHYYAIASKATILKPNQLPVPEAKFEDFFGVSWKDALAAGDVYNAMDACAYLEVDGDTLERECRKNPKTKFGGGFYCFMVNTIENKKPIYVFNAFFMSMRAGFVTPGTSIHWYTVDFDVATCKWADFRNKVLGPTNPADAPADSLRGLIMSQWEALGLAAEPNTGENGVHASASPFEGLAERMNWLKKDMSDPFAKELLAAGINEHQIKAWSIDPNLPGVGSLFDAVEDKDCTDCVAELTKISKASVNSAFVFVKPAANTAATQKLVAETFAARGITITGEGELTGEEIDAGKLIDQHYYAIASKATILKPEQLPVPEEKFEAAFGLSWKDALDQKVVYNAMDACAYLECDATTLEAEWKKNPKTKFGGGFYCGMVNTIENKKPIYVFNAFFMTMRAGFVTPGTSIHWYTVDFDTAVCKWSDFRNKVLGPTNPADAPTDSLRGLIMSQWEALGLKAEPNTGENGVHASASPFEGLAERMNWLKKDMTDPFAQKLLAAGVTDAQIKAWSIDPCLPEVGSLFDAMEDLDCGACVEKAAKLSKM